VGEDALARFGNREHGLKRRDYTTDNRPIIASIPWKYAGSHWPRARFQTRWVITVAVGKADLSFHASRELMESVPDRGTTWQFLQKPEAQSIYASVFHPFLVAPALACSASTGTATCFGRLSNVLWNLVLTQPAPVCF